MSAEESKAEVPTALVTGASAGIGLAIVTKLVSDGWNVYATVRKPSEELTKVGPFKVIEGVDIAEDGVGEVLKAGLGDARLDLLINNAGVFSMEKFEDLDFKQMQWMYNVNAVGPLRVIRAVLPNIKEKTGKIVNVSTSMASLTINAADPSMTAYSYRASKVALNMSTQSLAYELKPKGIAVLLICPGFVLTRLTASFGDAGQISPEESAAHVVGQATKLTIETTGSFVGTKNMFGQEMGNARPW